MKVEGVLFIMAATIVTAWMTLNLWFLHIGSSAPDPVTARTFVVSEMGTLYIVPFWGHLSSLLCFVGFAAMAIAAGVGLVRGFVKWHVRSLRQIGGVMSHSNLLAACVLEG